MPEPTAKVARNNVSTLLSQVRNARRDPNANIEGTEKDKVLPVFEIDSLWREGPVLSVRLGEKNKETTNELDIPRSIRNPRLRLVVVLCSS